MPDLEINDYGTVATITPASDAGHEWLAGNIPAEPWQWLGDSLAVEPRMMNDIIEGALDDGLDVEII